MATLAIFYFHFGDTTKQDARNLLSSVLFQLCSQSDKFSEVLSSIHSSHGDGSREPSIVTLLGCLKTILALQGRAPLYIVVDALDECPNLYGLRTQRQEVLEILKELIELKLPHVHFCVTSRPEIDIRRVFDSLNPDHVSLHNQGGQIRDLAEYVKSVVCSDITMQNWPAKVKELVIDTLATKGGGMYVIVVLTRSISFSRHEFRFRWAHCQLETLRQCPLRYISSTLDELPETLDGTYERILQSIPKKMQKDAHCIFQWIMVSSRPLSVEEVAEVFAVNFDEEMCGIPIFEPSWRDANAETAVLSACSTLVTIVDDWWGRKKVQFSHFSVQEYLTSDRVTNSEHVSRFHLHPKLAHTLLAKACLSVLLHLDHLDYNIDSDEVETKDFPLAKYAAKHWVEHAQFENVSWYIRDGMDRLFEKDRPHFATWVRVYDMDIDRHGYSPKRDVCPEALDPVPLYYAALCGFSGLVERLLTAHPQDLDAGSSSYGAPLNAALAKGHVDIAQFLLDRGAVGDNMGLVEQTGLYITSSRGYADVVRSLIDRGANLNVKCRDRMDDGLDVMWTPLHAATYKGHPNITLLLLEHGADAETRSSMNETALYVASSRGCAVIVRQLINHGANPNAKCEGWTPLHAASCHGRTEIARILLEHGSNPNALDHYGATALHQAFEIADIDLLLEYGANINARDIEGWTLLHRKACYLDLEFLVALLDRGADPRAQTNKGKTPFQLANAPAWWVSKTDQVQIIQLLSERTGERI